MDFYFRLLFLLNAEAEEEKGVLDDENWFGK